MLYPQKTSNSSSPTMTSAPSLPGQAMPVCCAENVLEAVDESVTCV